ncbi:MAG: YicC/YloC family endoribonuclease [Candidatus Methylopumilus sp.]
MIYSMTGFASLERQIANGVLVLELRSVNHRYLELHMKLDEHLRNFEPLVREMISAKLGRGKVECRMSLMQRSTADKALVLDEEVLSNLSDVAAQIQKRFPNSQALSVAELLHWPGVVQNQQVDSAQLAEEIKTSLQQILQDMTASRAREGAKMKALILERLSEAEQLVAKVKPLLPVQVKTYQDKLTAKLQEALKSVDEDRVRQELVLFAQRIDVDEELTRLTAHISEVKRILDADQAAGKRLDFLMQELNREANTLGSKSVSTEVSQTSMSLKVLIEQMREQIQNIE